MRTKNGKVSASDKSRLISRTSVIMDKLMALSGKCNESGVQMGAEIQQALRLVRKIENLIELS